MKNAWIDEASQRYSENKKTQKRCQDVRLMDLGSRAFLNKYNEMIWYPAEVDVSIRASWFYHPLQRLTVKSLKKLMRIYYDSIGSNCLLILNIPPNRKGVFSEVDVARLAEMGSWINKENICVIDSTYEMLPEKMTYVIRFEKQSVDRIRLSEDTRKTQRVEKFGVYANGKRVFSGTVIGFSKIAIFSEPVTTDELRLVIEECRKKPCIERIEVCQTGAYRPYG